MCLVRAAPWRTFAAFLLNEILYKTHTTHTHPHTCTYAFHYTLYVRCIGMAGNDAVKKHSSTDNTCRYQSIIRLWPFQTSQRKPMQRITPLPLSRAYHIISYLNLYFALYRRHITYPTTIAHTHYLTHEQYLTYAHAHTHFLSMTLICYVPMMNHLMGISLTAKSN